MKTQIDVKKPNQTRNQTQTRWIWALDPSEPIGEVHRKAVDSVQYLSKYLDFVIEPVTVLSYSPEVYGSVSQSTGLLTSDVQEEAKIVFEKYLQALQLPSHIHCLQPQILKIPSMSKRSLAETLSHYASKHNADMIVVQSEGHTQIERLIFGSFTETLLFKSKVPVWIASKNHSASANIHKILFPTDFGDHTTENFNRVLELAKNFNAKIDVFHALRISVSPEFASDYSGGTTWQAYQVKMLGAHRRLIYRRIEQWKKKADAKGVKMEFIMEPLTSLTTGAGVIEIAEERKSDLIMMDSHTGPIVALLLGSTSRQVVRSSPCPILILKHGMKPHVFESPQFQNESRVYHAS